MSNTVKQGTDVADPKVGANQDSVKAAKKELARQEREARKEAKRLEREAEKAEIDALKAAKKEKLDRLQQEKEDTKRAAADQKLRDEQALKNDVDSAAVEIRAGEENIQKYDRMSTPEVEKIGNRLIDIKPKLKLYKPKIGFQVWIETVCGLLYRRANNYMRVATAIAEDPALREMRLTELYEHLGLVTRTRTKTDDSSDDDDDDEDDDAPARKPHLAVGPLNARWYGGSYVMDLGGADWQIDLHQAIDDPNFISIINGRGLLIRLKDDSAGAAE